LSWVNKPSNLVVTIKSYIEKTKVLRHNKKATKASEHPEKGVGIKTSRIAKTIKKVD